MFNIGPWELALILLVALIVVGPGKLPEVAKSIGKGINEFKKVTSGYKKELQDAMDGVDSPVKQYTPEPLLDKKEEVIVNSSNPAPEEKKEDAILNLANNFESVVLDKKEELDHSGSALNSKE